ncbi:MAG: hypothetical protein CMO55_25460 [Verrucomicrobiales bacterium]|nr:hypothetical protein [Verrucomicrobiales bacterium]
MVRGIGAHLASDLDDNDEDATPELPITAEWVKTPKGVTPTSSGSAPIFAIPPEELNRLFPDLEILELLGQGGMGAVYKARQPRLDRIVALKVLSCAPELQEPFSLRFEQEAQLLAKLHHPKIVTLFDFGEIKDGPEGYPIFFFLMEFIDGGNLEEKLLSGNEISPGDTFRLILECCEALAFAHSKGILHRDIKPANLLIDREGILRVADFGVAKILSDDESPVASGLTITGTTVGTPHYMAPEMWDRPDKADHRADLYSLGVVFYQLLTGERPAGVFEAPSQLAAVDRKVDTVVLKALEKNPDRRYQDANEMHDAVKRVAKRHQQRANRKRKNTSLFTVASLLILAVAVWFTTELFKGENTTPPSAEHSDRVTKVVSEAAAQNHSPSLFSRAKPGRLKALMANTEVNLSEAKGITDFVQVGFLTGRSSPWLGLREDGELIHSEKGIIGEDVRAIVPEKGLAVGTPVAYLSESGTLHSFDDRLAPISLPPVRHLFLWRASPGYHVLAILENGDVDAIKWGQPSADIPSPPPDSLLNEVAELRSRDGISWLIKYLDGQAIAWSPERTFEYPAGTPRLLDIEPGKEPDWWPAVTPDPVQSDDASYRPILRSIDGNWFLQRDVQKQFPELTDWFGHVRDLPISAFSVGIRSNSGDEAVKILWIEPEPANTNSFSQSDENKKKITPGRLRAYGNFPLTGHDVDLSVASSYDDFVDVVGTSSRWVALRQNGQSISSDGKLNREGISKLVRGLDNDIALITVDGQVVFPIGETPEGFPSSSSYPPIIDAALGIGHGILLAKNGYAIPWSSEGDWELPPDKSLKNVIRVGAIGDYAATLLENGEFHIWGRSGPVNLSIPKELGEIRDFAHINMDHFNIESDQDHLWKLSFPRDLPPSNATFTSLGDGALKCGKFYIDENGGWKLAGVAFAAQNHQDLIGTHVPKGIEVMSGYGRENQREDPSWSWRGYAIWIEPSETLSQRLPDLNALPRGRLRATGTRPNQEPANLEKADFDDFVDVGGRLGQWVALRSNGETISSDGSADFSGIAKIGHSYGNRYVLIGSDGKLRFRERDRMSIPPEFENAFCIDAKLGMGHGIALTTDGRALVFGQRYEEDFISPDPSYESPQWPTPPASVLSDIKDIAVSQTHAATLKGDGTLSIFGWKGVIPLPEDREFEKVVDIASSEDEFWILDDQQQVWRLGLDRGPNKNPVGHAGKLIKTAKNALKLGTESWLEPNLSWRSNRPEMDEMLRANQIRNKTRFALSDGLHDGEHYHSLLWIDTPAPENSSPQ